MSEKKIEKIINKRLKKGTFEGKAKRPQLTLFG